MTTASNTRNFCIIAHIDHGKSTLADRLLEQTNTVAARDMRNQVLDQMDLERERGITIKLAPARMFKVWQGVTYTLNLIDTPGHVDFGYEVSRSLAAVEGALLLVDATQGIQAQTLTNLHLAQEAGLTIIPVVNKIDLPNALTEQVVREVAHLCHVAETEVCKVSAKTGAGVDVLLEALIQRIPPPQVDSSLPLRALIFDSHYDDFRGVIAYVRIMEGEVAPQTEIRFMQSKAETLATDIGILQPEKKSAECLRSGDIGYIVTGLKQVSHVRVGDTITSKANSAAIPLPGYRTLQPMVYASIFSQEGQETEELRDALQKLSLNDASLSYEAEYSPALGYGFRCGFLGLLHLDIISERLRREYHQDIVITIPSVGYHIFLNEAGVNAWKRRHKEAAISTETPILVASALELPEESHRMRIEEPWVTLTIVTPAQALGSVYELVSRFHGMCTNTSYLDETRVLILAEMPLAGILVDFYDKLKSATSGYASYHYDMLGYRPTEVIRLDLTVAGEPVDALASLVHADDVDRFARTSVERLKTLLPQQMFEVRIQASVGSRVIASSRIPPLRKDVTAKLYGGDVTRKRKLLEKQKKGKKRMRTSGRIAIPQEAYIALLKR